MIRRYMVEARRRVQFALSHPGYSARSLLRELTLADERFLAKVSGVSWRRIREYIDEPFQDPHFLAHLKNHGDEFHRLKISTAELFAKKILIQYALVRSFLPECIVETGIANGVSSSYLLYALHRNNKGKLHSVGLNEPGHLPVGREPGWLVPQDLRRRWSVIIGASQDVLPGLLRELREVDVFVHDSLHTYEHMKFEFELAYPYLKSSGILVADDASWNRAFQEFAHASGATLHGIIRGVGVLKKPFQPHSHRLLPPDGN
jgi:methyltransferase family protein